MLTSFVSVFIYLFVEQDYLSSLHFQFKYIIYLLFSYWQRWCVDVLPCMVCSLSMQRLCFLFHTIFHCMQAELCPLFM